MKFLDNFKPKDVIAVIIVIMGLVLLFLGIDHIVGTLLIAVVAYYFGEKYIIKEGDNYVTVKVKKNARK